MSSDTKPRRIVAVLMLGVSQPLARRNSFSHRIRRLRLPVTKRIEFDRWPLPSRSAGAKEGDYHPWQAVSQAEPV